ncbi:hypothetical protein M758_8G141100 [Ceratodon purpureus]|nr:hypothetical protein M758_8G141100 [Ceratodon purpureus]
MLTVLGAEGAVGGPGRGDCGAAAWEFWDYWGRWGRWRGGSGEFCESEGGDEGSETRTGLTGRERSHRGDRERAIWAPMMAGVPADTQGSTALKALATDSISSSVLQSANLLHLLRNAPHSETIAKLPKDLSLKIPIIKTTGELLEQMPSVIVALDSHLDNAIRSSSMLKEVRSILVDSPHSPPTLLPTNHFQGSSSQR